jgi:hypothetical protein
LEATCMILKYGPQTKNKVFDTGVNLSIMTQVFASFFRKSVGHMVPVKLPSKPKHTLYTLYFLFSYFLTFLLILFESMARFC